MFILTEGSRQLKIYNDLLEKDSDSDKYLKKLYDELKNHISAADLYKFRKKLEDEFFTLRNHGESHTVKVSYTSAENIYLFLLNYSIIFEIIRSVRFVMTITAVHLKNVWMPS